MYLQVKKILDKYNIAIDLIGDTFKIAKDAYAAIKQAGDPLSEAEHLALFNAFWKEATGGKAELSAALKMKIIRNRGKIPDFYQVAIGYLVRYDFPSLAKVCKLSVQEEVEVWASFHKLAPQFATRDCEKINRVLGIYNMIEDKIKSGKISVLDIGCGSHGTGISTLSARYDGKITGFGIDLNIKEHPSNVQLFKASAERLPFKDNSFDIIYACETIYYFEDKALVNVMHEALRVLKRGGIFVFNEKRFGADKYRGIIPMAGIPADVSEDKKNKAIWIIKK